MSRLAPYVVSLDLEFNQPSGKIVQIGAVLGDLRTQSVVSRFSRFVNPGEPLEPFISDLCGIDPVVLDLASPLADTYAEMLTWLEPFAQERQLNPLTWGGGDSMYLKEQLGLQDRWAFGRRWVDVKTVYGAWQAANGNAAAGGLRASMRKVGLPFEGRPHDAADDAHNTFLMYCRLLSLIREGPPVPARG